jgi:ABC-type antimicrobial peptide transport system permease subunit
MEGLNIKSSYDYSRAKYIQERREDLQGSLISGIVILAISLIEIYLMIRSSFLSRIKEVGIYRAIGMKKKDIYKMFTGEIIAITSMASLLGVAFMTYVLKELSFMDYYADMFMINTKTVLVTIAFIYLFNLVVGLLPIKIMMRKTPAQILSRNDI